MASTNSDTQSSRQTATLQLDRLIADARAGSAAALDALLERLAEHLWAELGSRSKPRGLGPSHGLSDLIQDTLVRVRQKFSKFERQTFVEFQQWARAVLHRRRQEWIRNFRARNSAPKKEKIWLAVRSRAVSDIGARQQDPAQHREETERADAALALSEKTRPAAATLSALTYPSCWRAPAMPISNRKAEIANSLRELTASYVANLDQCERVLRKLSQQLELDEPVSIRAAVGAHSLSSPTWASDDHPYVDISTFCVVYRGRRCFLGNTLPFWLMSG